jgi:hypothetical protein
MTTQLRATGFTAPHCPAHGLTEVDACTLTCNALVDELAAALNLASDSATPIDTWSTDQRRLPHVAFGRSADSHGAIDAVMVDDRYHDGGDDFDALPRLFARVPAVVVTKRTKRPQRSVRPSSGTASPLSGRTVALGFAMGLAVAGPITWVAAQTSGLGGFTQPPTMISQLAPFEAPDAAFDEASRRLARGDYIGARDLLRHAVAAGEDRARALLNALD